ncbi:MAG: NADP-dependent oxidoreductase [Cellvibrionaceae bacterium]|nr:NADP-dependent oxidoreductase [Cellvibrionaceae bacterium]
MAKNLAIRLTARPSGGPISEELFEIVELPQQPLHDGQFLVRQSSLSLDPAMFGWMLPDKDSYIPPVALGEVMRGSGVGEVLESRHPDFKTGDKVRGMFGWQTLITSNGSGVSKIDPSLSDEMVLSVFSLPGLTATHGFYHVLQPEVGQTLVVSGAAGSVGSIVGQLAKAEGLHVVGVAGSDEKCEWLTDELGFDAALNYKTADLENTLATLTPEGIDRYFENTGGAIQLPVYNRMNAHGRIAVCGLIAEYGGGTEPPGLSWINIIKKRLTVQGFTMPDHLHQAPTLLEKLTPHVVAGKIKYRSHVLEGLPSAIEGLNLFTNGGNKGKLMVRL